MRRMKRAVAILVCAVGLQLLYPLVGQEPLARLFFIRADACSEYFDGWSVQARDSMLEKISDFPEYHCELWLRKRGK